MTTHTTSPTQTLREGDVVVLGGEHGTVSKCYCGETCWLLRFPGEIPAPAYELDLTSHEDKHGTLEGLTESVRKAFAELAPAKPAFKAGDRVRIRTWESMEKEFGLDRVGDIKTKFFFTTAMKSLCGKEFTIERIVDHRVDGHSFGARTISTDMIELAAETKAEVPALAVGQKWRTRGGEIVTVEHWEGALRVTGRPWWYESHKDSKTCHSPGILGQEHKDTLVELITDTIPADDSVILKLTKRQAETLLLITRHIDFADEPAEKPVQPRIEPIFKEGQVWRTKGGYLMRVHKIDPNGMGRARVIHTPAGRDREDYERLWGIHPKGGHFNHTDETDDLTQVPSRGIWPEGNTDDRFAFVEPIAY